MNRKANSMIISLCILLLFPCLAASAVGAEIYQQGIASWYAGEFQGKLTANGEVFDTHTISAAHKELPFGTVVRVTNLKNGLQVEVRINDRGPYVGERIIDLSMAAAEAIDMVEDGISEVTLEVLFRPESPESAYDRAEDAELVRIQIGAYSSVETAMKVYSRLQEKDLQPFAEITESRLIRISVRWVPQDERDSTEKLLADLGFEKTVTYPDSRD